MALGRKHAAAQELSAENAGEDEWKVLSSAVAASYTDQLSGRSHQPVTAVKASFIAFSDATSHVAEHAIVNRGLVVDRRLTVDNWPLRRDDWPAMSAAPRRVSA